MKIYFTILIGALALAVCVTAAPLPSDIDVVLDAQVQALDQAHELLNNGGNMPGRAELQAAVKLMEKSRAALQDAKKTPADLPAALAAEQAAYQALLKATPREYRMSNSRNRSQGSSGPNQREFDQLDMPQDDNRYETESQAQSTPTAQEKGQSETLARLKQMARRQQDLNDRLRELQTALQQARTDQEREEIQRQLKRLRDEERQMLSDVDQLRQQMEQSSNSTQQAQARQQLEQTHTDIERAAQQLDKQEVSEALAAGSRAEQNLQDLRENMRQQTSSQFGAQMRQMRNQARDLSDKENQIAKDLDRMNSTGEKTLEDSSQRQALADQLKSQQAALTNLLGQVRSVTEQAEATEPLLSKQLYDIYRRADQAHTENQLDVSSQLAQRGFLPQASQSEQTARHSIDDLRQGVDRAAESVLGSETEALQFAKKQLDTLTDQMSGELKTNTAAAATNSQDQSLSQIARQLGKAGEETDKSGPISGSSYMDWSDQLRDVEQVVDSGDIRNQLATVRERVGAYRRNFRQTGRMPPGSDLRDQVLGPLALARDWVAQELARAQNDHGVVPLDRDPVEDKYSDMVRKYYEKLGSSQ
jgi:hypothetical protein